jgi:Flp pilus assembly protein TadG
MALTFPIIVMIVAGLVHFGMAMRAQHIITNASRVGARRVVQQGCACDDQSVVMNYCAQAGMDTSRVGVQTQIITAANEVRVTVTHQFSSPTQNLWMWIVNYLSGQTPAQLNQLSSTTVMRL